MDGKEKIVLGSGKLYMTEWDGLAIPDNATLEVDTNLLGLIKGGANLAYTPTFYEAKDDLGLKSKKILTDEAATLSSGIMTWNGKTLNKLIATGVLTEAAGKRTLKIGGMANYNDKKYVIRFLHEDEQDGDIRVTIVGSNNTGFTLAFAKEGETVINAEFVAVPHDATGTLIIYEEEIPTV